MIKSKKNNKILIIGGGGYIGLAITEYFLKKKYEVICYDNFLYNHKKYCKKFLKDSNFTLIDDELKNFKKYNQILNKFKNIIVLASVVGDPISKKYPVLSREINVKQTKKFINQIASRTIDKFIFVSTCSNYGIINENDLADEKFKLNPKSIYAKNKVEVERYLSSIKKRLKAEITVLRFATAFGISPRMRFDLTVNEFVREIFLKNKLMVFDPYTWRPYCHVKDFSKILELVLFKKIKRKKFEIFNAGSSKNNYTKYMVLKEIKKLFKKPNIIIKKNDVDPRNYRVNFEKLKKMYNFKPSISLKMGIKEIYQSLKKKNFLKRNKYPDKLGNYKIIKL
jgi:nucleoside-diphosphate-sugar epimerase